jgi:hypothetical protein
VPALAPELRGGEREVGPAEVIHEAQAEEQRDADGNIGVAREVAVDLEGEEVDADQELHRRREGGNGEVAVYQRRQVVDGTTAPVGYSFYAFSAASYLVDAYLRRLPETAGAGPTAGHVALYLAYFPKILAGPI